MKIPSTKPIKQFTVKARLATSFALPAFAQTPPSLNIPDNLETPLGTLEFKDGAPSAATAQKLHDNLDFLHVQNAFLNTFQGKPPAIAAAARPRAALRK
jgi:hypothetical protein